MPPRRSVAIRIMRSFAADLQVVIAAQRAQRIDERQRVRDRTAAPRPFCALFARTRPPGTVMPELAPWPAMPLLATEPVRLMIDGREVDAADDGTMPASCVGAAL